MLAFIGEAATVATADDIANIDATAIAAWGAMGPNRPAAVYVVAIKDPSGVMASPDVFRLLMTDTPELPLSVFVQSEDGGVSLPAPWFGATFQGFLSAAQSNGAIVYARHLTDYVAPKATGTNVTF